MKEKILVLVYIPVIEKELDVYIPLVKRVGSVKNLITSIIEEDSDGAFINDGTLFLYDKLTGERLDDREYVINSIKNGSKLILY